MISLNEARELAEKTLSKKRFQHTLNVEEMAVKLADKNGVDPNKAALAALLHDIAKEMAPNYPDVTVEFMFVDNAAMQIIQRPTHFDVIVTENLFGDILTDESSVISGSLGMLPSASVGAKVALFEPIHGSYPQAAGKNIANPMATILSAAMMLEHVGLDKEGKAIRDAVNKAIEAGVVTEDLADAGAKVYSTTEVGDYVAAAI